MVGDGDDPESLTVQVLDVSINRLCWILTCPFFHGGCFCPYQTVLYLRRHDMERHDRSVCGGRRSTRPYDQLGHVVVSDCFCLVCVDSELGTILPGNGCDRDTCHIIAQTLRDRQQQGDSASTSRWNRDIGRQMVDRTEALERKMDVILDHIGSRNNREQQQPLPATGVVVHTGPSPPPRPALSMSMSDR